MKQQYVKNPVDLPHVPQNCCCQGAPVVNNGIVSEKTKKIIATSKVEGFLILRTFKFPTNTAKVVNEKVDKNSILIKFIGSLDSQGFIAKVLDTDAPIMRKRTRSFFVDCTRMERLMLRSFPFK